MEKFKKWLASVPVEKVKQWLDVAAGIGLLVFMAVMATVFVAHNPSTWKEPGGQTTFVRVVDNGRGGLWVWVNPEYGEEYFRRREQMGFLKNHLPVGSNCWLTPAGELADVPPPATAPTPPPPAPAPVPVPPAPQVRGGTP